MELLYSACVTDLSGGYRMAVTLLSITVFLYIPLTLDNQPYTHNLTNERLGGLLSCLMVAIL